MWNPTINVVNFVLHQYASDEYRVRLMINKRYLV